MIRQLIAFLLVWGFVFFGISYFWHTSPTVKFNMLKAAAYSFMTAGIAFATLAAIVILF